MLVKAVRAQVDVVPGVCKEKKQQIGVTLNPVGVIITAFSITVKWIDDLLCMHT